MSNLKFRVALDVNDDVFRDIIIGSDSTFLHLYNAILDAFEFNGDELASFYISNDTWDRGQEIALIDMGSDPGTPEDMHALEMASTLLGDLATQVGNKFILVYDFLRMWCFYVEVIELNAEVEMELPILAYAFGDAPDEFSKPIESDELDMGMMDEFDEEDEDDEYGFNDFEGGFDETEL